MKLSKILKLISISFTIFLLGCMTGAIIDEIPFLEFNNEIKLYEILNLTLTLGIGILIPFYVKKWIEDSRSIKSDLAHEVKIIIETLRGIESIISKSYKMKKISALDKDDIVFLFHQMELQINSLEKLLLQSFSEKTDEIINQIKQSYFRYERFLTGGDLMISKYKKIDDNFHKNHKQSYFEFETELKTTAHKIHKL